MNKKLTLNIDEDLISFAHVYSKEANSSLSNIIENFILSLKKNNNADDVIFSNKTSQLVGAFKNNKLPSAKEMKRIFNEEHFN